MYAVKVNGTLPDHPTSDHYFLFQTIFQQIKILFVKLK
jgi:hypothetical protein